jgi:hypothetical protein
MKSITKLSMILLVAATCATGPVQAQDASTPPATAVPKPARPHDRYTGIIESIDSNNMILTLKVRTNEVKVKISATTKIMKDRLPATFADAAVGQRVRGSGKKGEDMVWTARTLDIVTKPRARKPASPPGTAQSQ